MTIAHQHALRLAMRDVAQAIQVERAIEDGAPGRLDADTLRQLAEAKRATAAYLTVAASYAIDALGSAT